MAKGLNSPEEDEPLRDPYVISPTWRRDLQQHTHHAPAPATQPHGHGHGHHSNSNNNSGSSSGFNSPFTSEGVALPPRKAMIQVASSTEDDESPLFPELLGAMTRFTLHTPSPASSPSPRSPMSFSTWSTPASPLASVNEDGSSQDQSSSHSEFLSGSASESGQSSGSSLSLRNTPYAKAELVLDVDGMRYFACPIPSCAKRYRNKGDLKEHARSTHPELAALPELISRPKSTKDGKPFGCPLPDCTCGYKSRRDLLRHLRKKHREYYYSQHGQ